MLCSPTTLTATHSLFGSSLYPREALPLGLVSSSSPSASLPPLGIGTLTKPQSEKMEVPHNKGLSCDLREQVKSTGGVSWSETGRRAAPLVTQPVRRIHFLLAVYL